MPDIKLAGCTPEPLQSYGKAIGVFRLVAEQRDPSVRALWRGDSFVLRTELDQDALRRFFLDEYRPTPIVSPWNLDSGFFGGRQGLGRLAQSTDPRLATYRVAIDRARRVLSEAGLGGHLPRRELKPKLALRKAWLIARLRGTLPDEAIRWLDASVVLTGGQPSFPPLFGVGGSDGRFELSDGFMNALVKIFEDRAKRPDALDAALFGVPRSSVESVTPGLFAPGGVGGPNSLEGFEGGGGANLWDIVLAFEGFLLLAASAARRFGSQTEVRAAFPFILRGAVAAGYPTAARESARGEVWLPLWDRPAALVEIRHVFREGRAEWNGKPAMSGVDVARALVSLGVDRGLTEFRRYGIQNRSGRSYLASPLGRFRVRWRPEALLLAELDPFLDGLASLRGASETPAEFLRLARRLDDAVLAYCAEGDRERLLDVLVAVAQVDRALGLRASLRSRGRAQPAPLLSRRWVYATKDQSVEFSIAAALASLLPARREMPGAMRQYLAPVERRRSAWRWRDTVSKSVVWTGRDTVADVVRVVERRLLEAERAGERDAFRGSWFASPPDVASLLRGEVDFGRMGRLIEALSLVDWELEDGEQSGWQGRGLDATTLPITYALIKLTTIGDEALFAQLGARAVPRFDPTTVTLLRAGHIWEAGRRAARRLRAIGLTPVAWERIAAETRPMRPDPALGRRFVAGLAVPLRPAAALVQLVLEDQPVVAQRLEPATA